MRNETKSRIRVSMAVLALCGLGIAASPTVRAEATPTAYGKAGYTAGNGITITQTGSDASTQDEYSIKLASSNSYLSTDENGGLKVNIASTDSYLSADTNGGLKVTVNGVISDTDSNKTGLVTGSTVYEYIKSITGTSSASVGEGQSNLVTGHAVHSYVRNLTGSQATDISDDGTKLVTGKAVYKYTTPVAKSEYSLKTVSTANSVGTNLGLLDAAIQDTNTDMAKLIRLADVSEKGTIKIGTGVTATTVSIADSNSKARRLAGVDTAVNNTDAVNFKQMTDTINSYGVAQTQTIYATATDDGNVIKSKDGKSKLATFSLADASNLDANNTGFVSGGTLYTYVNNLSQGVVGASGVTDSEKLVTGQAVYTYLSTSLADNTTLKFDGGVLKANTADVSSSSTALATGAQVAAYVTEQSAGVISNSDSNKTKLVTGETVYTYLSPTEAGNYIKTGANNTTAANLKALDDAIGAKDNGYYIQKETSSTVYSNLKALDSAIGAKLTKSDYTALLTTNTVTQNLEALDSKIKSNGVLAGQEITATNKTIKALDNNTSLATIKVSTVDSVKGSSSSADTGFVSGDVLYNYTKPVAVTSHTLTNVSETENVGTNLGKLDAAIEDFKADTAKLITSDTSTIKIGSGIANTVKSVSFLASDGSTKRKLTGIAAGEAAGDAVEYSQMNTAISKAKDEVTAATDKLIKVDSDAIKIGSDASGATSVSFLNGSTARRLTGVAAGQNDTDAVNVGQLYSAYVGSDTITITKETDPAQNVIRVKNMAMSTMWDSAKAPTAAGNYSFAIGGSADASGNYAYALGSGSKATGTGSVALGGGAEATWTALSPDSSGTTGGTIAIGPNAKASGNGGAAIGAEAVATGEDSVAFGSLANAAGYEGTAIGSSASAGSMSATAIGAVSNASGIASSAFGYYSKASGDASTTLGYGSGAMGTGTTSVGAGAKAYNGADYSVAIGANSESQAQKSVAIGFESVASEANTVSFGHKSTDMHKTAQGSVAYGSDSLSWLTNVADGRKTHEAATWDQLVQSGQSVTLDGNTTSYTFKNNAQGEVFTVGITKGAVSQGNTGYVTGGDVWNAIAKYAQTINFSNVGQTTQGGQQGAAQGGASTTTESNKIYTNDGQVIATIEQGEVAQNNKKMVSGGDVWNADIAKDQSVTFDGTTTSKTFKNNANEDVFTVGISKGAVDKNETGFTTGGDVWNADIAKNQSVTFDGTTTSKTFTNNKGEDVFTVGIKKSDVAQNETGFTTGGDVWNADIAKNQSVTFDGTTTSKTFTNNKGDNVFTVGIKKSDVAQNETGFTTGGDVWSADVEKGQKIYLEDGKNELKNNNGDVLATFHSSEVAEGDSGFVSGGDLFEEVRPADGVYVRAGMTTAENLNTLDYALAETNDRINRVGAGAAALAALHPEDFNPEDKWSFAAGYGHYKNANAGAFGVFYKPNADTTVSLASTIGNGNTMVNAGVSFKLGQRGVAPVKPDAKTIQKLATENASQAKKIETLEADNAQMKADNEKMKAQIAEILKKLELSETVQKSAAH